MEQLKYKAVNFDLITDNLKIYYSASNPTGAYGKIQSYMEKNGFEHRQYSGYLSKNKISDTTMDSIISDMAEKFPWLPYCARCMDVTNVGKHFDYMPILKKYKKNGNSKAKVMNKNIQQKKKMSKPIKPVRKAMDLQQ